MSDSEWIAFMREIRADMQEVREDVARIRQEVKDIMAGPPAPKRKWWRIF